MNNSDLLKLALGGLAAGFCLFGQGCSKTPSEQTQKSSQPQQNGGNNGRCSGHPSCASCTVPSDCSDVSDCEESRSFDPLEMQFKRQKAVMNQKAGEAEWKKVY